MAKKTSGQYDLSALLFAKSVPVAAFAEDANTVNQGSALRKERLRVRMRGRNPALTIRKMEARLRKKLHGSVLITMSR